MLLPATTISRNKCSKLSSNIKDAIALNSNNKNSITEIIENSNLKSNIKNDKNKQTLAQKLNKTNKKKQCVFKHVAKYKCDEYCNLTNEYVNNNVNKNEPIIKKTKIHQLIQR